jgi:hypothetical protein
MRTASDMRIAQVICSPDATLIDGMMSKARCDDKVKHVDLLVMNRKMNPKLRARYVQAGFKVTCHYTRLGKYGWKNGVRVRTSWMHKRVYRIAW